MDRLEVIGEDIAVVHDEFVFCYLQKKKKKTKMMATAEDKEDGEKALAGRRKQAGTPMVGAG